MNIWNIYTRFCIYILLIYRAKFANCNDRPKPPPGNQARTTRESHGTGRAQTVGSRGARPYETGGRESQKGGKNSQDLLVVDVQVNKSTKDLEYSFDPVNKTHVYSCRDNCFISKVVNGGDQLWIASGSRYATKVTLGPGPTGKTKLSVFVPEDEPPPESEEPEPEPQDEVVEHIRRRRRRRQPSERRSRARDVPPQKPELKIITKDEFDDRKLAVNDISQYRLVNRGDVVDYIFNDLTSCVRVELGQERIWTCHDNKYPKSISYDQKQKRLVVRFEDNYLICQRNHDLWETALREYDQPVKKNNAPAGSQAARGPANAQQQTLQRTSVTGLPIRAVILDVYTKKTTNEFDYSRMNTKYGVYIPKHNFIFKVIRVGFYQGLRKRELDIWQPRIENEYVTKVVIDISPTMGKITNISLTLLNGIFKHFSYINENWEEIDPAIVLDLACSQDTLGFEYKHDRPKDTRTFIPKGYMLFKGVKKTHRVRYRSMCTEIWTATDTSEYANRIVLKGNDGGEKYLLLFLINGELMLFYKSKSGNPWVKEQINQTIAHNLIASGIEFNEYAKCIPECSPLVPQPALHPPQNLAYAAGAVPQVPVQMCQGPCAQCGNVVHGPVGYPPAPMQMGHGHFQQQMPHPIHMQHGYQGVPQQVYHEHQQHEDPQHAPRGHRTRSSNRHRRSEYSEDSRTEDGRSRRTRNRTRAETQNKQEYDEYEYDYAYDSQYDSYDEYEYDYDSEYDSYDGSEDENPGDNATENTEGADYEEFVVSDTDSESSVIVESDSRPPRSAHPRARR